MSDAVLSISDLLLPRVSECDCSAGSVSAAGVDYLVYSWAHVFKRSCSWRIRQHCSSRRLVDGRLVILVHWNFWIFLPVLASIGILSTCRMLECVSAFKVSGRLDRSPLFMSSGRKIKSGFIKSLWFWKFILYRWLNIFRKETLVMEYVLNLLIIYSLYLPNFRFARELKFGAILRNLLIKSNYLLIELLIHLFICL